MYSKKVLEIFQNPKNAGGVKNADGIGKAVNSACGDIMKIYIKVDENEVIDEAKFKTFGCCAAIASSEVACNLLKGKTIDEAKEIAGKEILDELGELPSQKIHCGMLVEEAIKSTIEDYYDKKEKKESK